MLKYLVILVIIFISYILYQRNNYPNYELFTGHNYPNYHRRVSYYTNNTAKHFFSTNKSAVLYLESVDKTTVGDKLPGNNQINNYYQFIQNFTSREKRLLKKMVMALPKSKLLSGDWNFYKTNRLLEYGMPFTLGNVIFMPDIDDSRHYKRTLVHEKMHVLQREYPASFNHFLEKTYKFRLVKRVY